MTRHLLTGFVLEHPGTKSLILEKENREQHLQMPEWWHHCGKIFPTLLPEKKGEVCGICSSGLVETCSGGAGGGNWRKESLFLGAVPSALCYQHLIPPCPLETLPCPLQLPSGGVWDSTSKQEGLSEERAAVGTRMDVPVLLSGQPHTKLFIF